MTQITCKHCSHKWQTKSTYKMLTCPSCLGKTANFTDISNNEAAAEVKDRDKADVVIEGRDY